MGMDDSSLKASHFNREEIISSASFIFLLQYVLPGITSCLAVSYGLTVTFQFNAESTVHLLSSLESVQSLTQYL